MSVHVTYCVTIIDYILSVFRLSHVASEDPTNIQISKISIFWFPTDYHFTSSIIFTNKIIVP